MIDLQSAYWRAYLDGANQRIQHAADTLDWAHGQQHLTSTTLIPPFPTDPTARAAAQADWNRYKQHLQSLGPRILKTKRTGAIGTINWGGRNNDLDERLQALDLRTVARNAFDPLCANGITAAWAYRHEDTNEARIQALGGYLEPIYPDDDPTSDPIGLYQVTQDPGSTKVRYRVRVYDFAERSIREWRDLSDPTNLEPIDPQWVNTSVPRVAVYDTNHDGYPVGELAQALNVLRAEVGVQARIMRVADAQAYGILTLAGQWEAAAEMGATTVLKAPESDARASRIEPASMESLFILHDRTMERLRSDLSLPIASIGGGTWPSGEALQQANIAFIGSSSDYAHLITTLLTGVVSDYCDLEGIPDAPPVSVSINREQMRGVVSNQVREDFTRGIISLRAAAVAISAYYPDWTDDEIEAFVTESERPVDVNAFLPASEGRDA